MKGVFYNFIWIIIFRINKGIYNKFLIMLILLFFYIGKVILGFLLIGLGYLDCIMKGLVIVFFVLGVSLFGF